MIIKAITVQVHIAVFQLLEKKYVMPLIIPDANKTGNDDPKPIPIIVAKVSPGPKCIFVVKYPQNDEPIKSVINHNSTLFFVDIAHFI